jgi:hypothetical protein
VEFYRVLPAACCPLPAARCPLPAACCPLPAYLVACTLRSFFSKASPKGGHGGGAMLWTLIVLLFLFWLLGFAFDVAGGIIHVLLVIAVVLFLVNLISGRRTVV